MSIARRALGTAGARTPIARAAVAAGARAGVTPYNWRLLRSTRRVGWHIAPPGRVPQTPIVARPPQTPDDADIALCERLIAAYDVALGETPAAEQTSGMWKWIYEQRHLELAGILRLGDSRALSVELAAMFRKTFMLGMAPGSLVSHSRSLLGSRIWRLKTLDAIVSLAEALGVVPVSGTEQRTTRDVFGGGLEKLAEGIEAALGCSIDFPQVGAPYGITMGSRLVTLETPELIYSAVRLDQAITAHLRGKALAAPRIVEIGGGYGATCMWLVRAGRLPGRYTIVDLPIVNVLQGYFLSQALGADQVSLLGEPAARVSIVPNSRLDAVEVPYDVLVNKDSMPEMPTATVREYLAWASSTCESIFYSCNHESAAPFLGEQQVLVPDLVTATGAFVRVRRDESWVRRGYVEEIYARADATPADR